jgi:hypothetical protein
MLSLGRDRCPPRLELCWSETSSYGRAVNTGQALLKPLTTKRSMLGIISNSFPALFTSRCGYCPLLAVRYGSATSECHAMSSGRARLDLAPHCTNQRSVELASCCLRLPFFEGQHCHLLTRPLMELLITLEQFQGFRSDCRLSSTTPRIYSRRRRRRSSDQVHITEQLPPKTETAARFLQR